jgi:PEP-CTERM motif
MSTSTVIARALAAAAVFCSATTFANPITFIYTGFGSGTLAGNAFASSSFTITAVGDTANKASCGGTCDYIDHDSVSITITGLGTFSFSTGTRTFFEDAADIAGFSRAGASGLDLFYSPQTAVLNGWDLTSSIGPISGVSQLLQWAPGFGSMETSGGTLVFTTGTNDSTFQAIADPGTVPEPTSLALAGLALLGCVAASRRRGA